jgi:hypothetical protein
VDHIVAAGHGLPPSLVILEVSGKESQSMVRLFAGIL